MREDKGENVLPGRYDLAFNRWPIPSSGEVPRRFKTIRFREHTDEARFVYPTEEKRCLFPDRIRTVQTQKDGKRSLTDKVFLTIANHEVQIYFRNCCTALSLFHHLKLSQLPVLS